MPKLFVGNWKMYVKDDEAAVLAQGYAEASAGATCDAAVAPSFTALERVAEALKGSRVALAAQDVFWMEKGAYTGEISAPILADLGVRFVIAGHSERRALFDETDEAVAKKTVAVLRAGMIPIVCVGETAEEKAGGQREEVIRRQLEAVFDLAAPAPDAPMIVAYEPRWAIGTGAACAPEEAVVVHRLIRELAADHQGMRVLYGGSVDSTNVASYVSQPEIDGVLVGGASVKIEEVRAMLAAISAF